MGKRIIRKLSWASGCHLLCCSNNPPLSAAVSTALMSDDTSLHNKGKAVFQSPVFQRDQTQTPLICNSLFSEPDDASVWSFNKSHFPSKYFTIKGRSLWLYSDKIGVTLIPNPLSRAHLEPKPPLIAVRLRLPNNFCPRLHHLVILKMPP